METNQFTPYPENRAPQTPPSDAAPPAEGAPEEAPSLAVPCDVYTRVVGYLSPVGNWNAGKKQEYGDRKTFDGSVSDAR